jgi:hypothetical protein
LVDGKTVFWLTLFLAVFVGVIVAVAAQPPQDLAVWVGVFPLVFLIVFFSGELFF